MVNVQRATNELMYSVTCPRVNKLCLQKLAFEVFLSLNQLCSLSYSKFQKVYSVVIVNYTCLLALNIN